MVDQETEIVMILSLQFMFRPFQFKEPYIYDVHMEGIEWGVLKLVKCL